LVADPWQGRGVGRELLGRLLEVGQREKISRIYADVLAANLRMQRLCSRLGFTFDGEAGGVVRAERRL
jgi:acetyltransferase